MSQAMQTWLRDYLAKTPAFLGRYKYYAHVLARLDPIDDPYVDVMAVSRHRTRFFLHVNVEFFLPQPQYLLGVVLHEVHHIVLGHLTHPKFRDVAHSDLMTLAMEVSANEFIQEPLPGQPVRLQDFAALGMRGGQSTRERYDLLVNARRQGLMLPLWTTVDDHHRHGVGGVAATAPEDLSGHQWIKNVLEEAQSALEREVGSGAASRHLLAGTTPGKLLERLMGVEREAEVFMDWKAALQTFVGQARAPVHRYWRPNRRFVDQIGVVPGRTFFSKRLDPKRILVAIDTSASMSRRELNEIAAQLTPLGSLADLTIAECDVGIQRVYPFAGSLNDVAGRGGTDLRPVFTPDFLAQHRPDGVVYFTDGFGPYPADDPGVPTLWVLSKPFAFGCPWGRKAFLPRAK